jgi:phosphatidylglycerophosphate synthase
MGGWENPLILKSPSGTGGMAELSSQQTEQPGLQESPGQPPLWTVPNLLSFYRLAASPVLLALVVMDQQPLFAVLFLVSLVSDILDGLIARLFHLQTPFGARLDSWADTATVWVGLAGLLRFAWPAIAAHLGGLVTGGRLATLAAADLRAFLALRRGEGLAAPSLARDVSALKGFFAWARRNEGLACDAIAALKAPKQPRRLH